jgi:metal-sulfur cluster biosynthetic enzyme
MSSPLHVKTLLDRLRLLEDPEVGLNIVDLGMVHSATCSESGAVRVELIPTTPNCPLQDQLTEGAKHLIQSLPGVTSVEVAIVRNPPWNPERISPLGRVFLQGSP